MTKKILAILIASITLVTLFSACITVNAGHASEKIDMIALTIGTMRVKVKRVIFENGSQIHLNIRNATVRAISLDSNNSYNVPFNHNIDAYQRTLPVGNYRVKIYYLDYYPPPQEGQILQGQTTLFEFFLFD